MKIMVKKIFKWTGIVLGGLFAIAVIIGTVLYFVGGSRFNKKYNIQTSPITIPTDEQTIIRGRHLVEAITLCQGCHGEGLEGEIMVDELLIGTISTANLTSGRGGIGTRYRDADYVRAIRHGVNPQGRGLMIMHSDRYNNLSEEDLGAMISYLKSMPPIDNEIPKTKLRMGKVFIALGLFDSDVIPLLPAEVIDHKAPFAKPSLGINAEHGKYLVSIAMCTMCHGNELKGAPSMEEGMPPGPNLVLYAGLWSEDQFISTIRKGVNPYGKTINSEIMPFNYYKKMTDEELSAIWKYIGSIAGR